MKTQFFKTLKKTLSITLILQLTLQNTLLFFPFEMSTALGAPKKKKAPKTAQKKTNKNNKALAASVGTSSPNPQASSHVSPLPSPLALEKVPTPGNPEASPSPIVSPTSSPAPSEKKVAPVGAILLENENGESLIIEGDLIRDPNSPKISGLEFPSLKVKLIPITDPLVANEAPAAIPPQRIPRPTPIKKETENLEQKNAPKNTPKNTEVKTQNKKTKKPKPAKKSSVKKRKKPKKKSPASGLRNKLNQKAANSKQPLPETTASTTPNNSPSPSPLASPSPVISPSPLASPSPLPDLSAKESAPKNKPALFFAVIEATYPNEDWNLVGPRFDSVKVRNGMFTYDVSIREKDTPIKFIAVSPWGEVETETFIISIPKFDEYLKRKPEPKYYQKLVHSGGIGLTSINYTDTRVDNVAASALTINGNVNFPIQPGKWDADASFFINAMSLSSSGPEGISPRFFGFNARAGYLVHQVKPPWILKLQGGFYYLTMLQGLYGFANVTGPQIFPSLTRLLPGRSILNTYVKFSPVSSGIFLESLASNEMATGITYAFPVARQSHYLSISLNVSRLNLVITQDDITEKATSKTFSLGIGYTFR